MGQGAVATMVAALTLTVAHTAQAAVVTNVAGQVTYMAASGEANRLVVERTGSALTLTDTGAEVLFGLPGCQSAGPHSIRCEGVVEAVVELRDGDDIFSAAGEIALAVDGGPGADRLVGAAGAERLRGGDGDDRLEGAGGGDRLDGGPGKDTVDYATRVGPLVVTLDGVRNDGAPGELDVVIGVEIVLGGRGGDVIEGDDGDNEIYGGPGDDSLGGGGGADVIDGGEGQDGVNALDPARSGGPAAGEGGAGAEGSSSAEAAGSAEGGDTIACGDGRDRVYGDDADGVGTDCEKVGRGAVAGISVGSRVAPGAPPPELGKTVVLEPLAGVVLVTPPEPGTPPRTRQDVPAAPAVPLTGEANVPVGSVVDTRFGKVELTVAVDRGAATESGQFEAGPFQVFQDEVVGTTTDLELRGGKRFAACPPGQKGPGITRAAKRQKLVRRLWSQAKGRFRTRGRFAAATVRGTRWLTADRCDGTLVTVREGAVEVADLARGERVLVRAGESRLVRSR